MTPDRVCIAVIWLRPNLLHAVGAALRQLRVIGWIPSPGGELKGLALLGPLHVTPEEIDNIVVGRFVFSFRQPVEFASQIFRYFDDAPHRSLYQGTSISPVLATALGKGDRAELERM
ncbi:MAG TPA: hypothetical protein VGV35_12225 [Bryobacteraceae bacterium]|nr:hypothetical protein [Bryobacteraceae bacterium]